MNIARPLLLVLLLLAAAASPAHAAPPAGAANHEATYEVRYLLVQVPISDLGGQVAHALDTADRRSDRQLYRQFRRFARHLQGLLNRLEPLHPPGDLQILHAKVLKTMRPLVTDLGAISRAARRHDSQAAGRATSRLGRHSRSFRSARRAVIRAIDRKLG